MSSVIFLFWGYAVLLRVCLSHRELDMARSVLQQMEGIGLNMNQFTYLHMSALFTTVDQIRLWLMDGELDRAMHWAEQLEETQQNVAPLVRERTEVALTRILLAKGQPAVALERLEPTRQRATKGKRWGHAIEIWLLQALAHQLLNQEMQALNALWEALHLAEPEGYIRRFLDEGAPMEALLYQLRKRERKHGPTPYLDTLIAAFQQESMAHVQAGAPTKPQPLPEPLSGREREVLQLLAQGASNQEIAQELVIAVDTVKRHVRQILSKLGVENRFQAARQAQALGLLDKDVE
jgi:LuxR family maltose regulon positive regulatory protein